MSGKASADAFLWAVVVGCGFRLGWGLVGLIIDFAARALSRG